MQRSNVFVCNSGQQSLKVPSRQVRPPLRPDMAYTKLSPNINCAQSSTAMLWHQENATDKTVVSKESVLNMEGSMLRAATMMKYGTVSHQLKSAMNCC